MNRKHIPMLIGVSAFIVSIAVLFTIPNDTAQTYQTNFPAHQQIISYKDLPVGIYKYLDVWSTTNDSSDVTLVTSVQLVEITAKDPVHHSLSMREISESKTVITLPEETKIRGALNRPGADVFTGLLEVSVTKEGVKQIATYFPFTNQ